MSTLNTADNPDSESTIDKDLLKKIVERFLTWPLPENFNPDAGIKFEPEFNKEYNEKHNHPRQYHKPSGTNLLDYTQAEQMFLHALGDIHLTTSEKDIESGEAARLSHIIDRDRYVVAIALQRIKKSIEAHTWLLEGRGPYEWDDDRYKEEFTAWVENVEESLGLLIKLAADKNDCTTNESLMELARLSAIQYARYTPKGHRKMIPSDIGI